MVETLTYVPIYICLAYVVILPICYYTRNILKTMCFTDNIYYMISHKKIHNTSIVTSNYFLPKPILIAQDDGTDIEFQNVSFYTSDAGEIPKRTQTINLSNFLIFCTNFKVKIYTF
jgi:hypothetical protein